MTSAIIEDIAWDELVEQADYDSAVDRKRRPTVDVPDKVLTLVTNARNAGRRFTLPVRSSAEYSALSTVLYSAGGLLEPAATVYCAPGIIAEGKFVRVDDPTKATHLRASVGNRRGRAKGAVDVADDGEDE